MNTRYNSSKNRLNPKYLYIFNSAMKKFFFSLLTMTKDVRKLFTISIRDQNIDYEIRNTKKKRNSNIKCQNSSGTTLQFLHATRYSFYATLSIFFS
jgi:hypothetical protein